MILLSEVGICVSIFHNAAGCDTNPLFYEVFGYKIGLRSKNMAVWWNFLRGRFL